MKDLRVFYLAVLVNMFVPIAHSQETNQPYVRWASDNSPIIFNVLAHEKMTLVTIDFQDYIIKRTRSYKGDKIAIDPSTTLSYIDPKTGQKIVNKIAQLDYFSSATKDFRGLNLGQKYSTTYDLEGYAMLRLIFKPLNCGVKSIDIQCPPFSWKDIQINEVKRSRNVGHREVIDAKLKNATNSFCGLYHRTDNGINIKTFAVIKDETIDKDKLFIVAYETIDNSPSNIGDILYELSSTANKNIYMGVDELNPEIQALFVFDDGILRVRQDGIDDIILIKETKDAIEDRSQNNIEKTWTGTGFALENGYIITNYHVIENANEIEIMGVDGDFNKGHKADVKVADRNNDLALLKVSGYEKGFGILPYKFKTATSEVGEEIGVLGYPLTATMGDEVKFTNGIISSKTGFQGDISMYQISAAIQPGNSGGPLFDKQGNIIGVVSSKHANAENVGYAIKAAYLLSLVDSAESKNILQSKNSISSLPLTEQIKAIKQFVYLIKCKAHN